MRAVTGLTTDYMAHYYNRKYPAAMPSEYCGQPPDNFVVNDIPIIPSQGWAPSPMV
nr:hypothetical protein [Psychrobacter sp. PraFG1]UNK06232.1 hypothetical protein MN210_06535 [Psychrobacter sp. PraFG1]